MPSHSFTGTTGPHERGSAGALRRLWVGRLSLALNVVLGIAVAALAVRALGDRENDGPPPSPWVTRMRLEIDPALLRGPPEPSPDGRLIAWPARHGIHVRSLDQLDDRLILRTEGA